MDRNDVVVEHIGPVAGLIQHVVIVWRNTQVSKMNHKNPPNLHDDQTVSTLKELQNLVVGSHWKKYPGLQ